MSGRTQRNELAGLLRERYGAIVFEGDEMHFRNGNDLAGIAQSCSLIVVVTDHVMEDPRVQAQVREAVTLDLPIIFVYETNKRFGKRQSRLERHN